MFFTNLVNNLKRDVLVTGLLYIVLGLVLLFVPGLALHLVGKLLGALVFLYGLANVVCYFRSDGIHPVFRFGLVYGVVFALIGALLFSRSGAVVSLVPRIFGVVLLVNAFSDLQSAFDLRRMRDGRWWLALAPTLITFALGLILLFNPFGTAALLVRILGGCLIYQGISNLLVSGRVSRHARSLGRNLNRVFDKDAPIETSFTDEKRGWR